MKHLIISIKIMTFFTVLCGLAYPLIITGIGQLLLPDQANGSLLKIDGQLIGSKMIGQSFEKREYFWPRPSAVEFNTLPSGGSNLGPTSEALKVVVSERRARLIKSNPESGEPPKHLLFASSSGLDPHISLEAAFYQIYRVAKVRSLEVSKVKAVVLDNINSRQFGFLGEETVNVLELNIALDKITSK